MDNLYRRLKAELASGSDRSLGRDQKALEYLARTFRYWGLYEEPDAQGKESLWVRFFRNVLTVNSYLNTAGRILSLGPSSARYGAHLETGGYGVTFVGIDDARLQQVRESTEAAGGSYVDDEEDPEPPDLYKLIEEIGDLPGGYYDMVLAFGLFDRMTREEERQTLSEGIRRVLKPDALLVAEFIPRAAFVMEALLEPRNRVLSDGPCSLASVWHSGVLEHVSGAHVGYYFAQVGEISSFFERAGFREEEVCASDGIASWLPRSVWTEVRGRGREAMDEVLGIIADAGEDDSTLGLSKHVLYVGRKTR